MIHCPKGRIVVSSFPIEQENCSVNNAVNYPTPADLMVITAHPDDAEFGAAGTVARWTREGKKAVYVV